MRPLVCILLAGVFQAYAANSIEAYLDAPFASELTAAPGGGRIAWVVNERGARNVWTAAAPDWKARKLTAYTGDDGQDIGELAWSADGRTIAYTRGGELENGGENPNPRDLAEPPEQAIYVAASDGSAPPRRLAVGHAAAVASNGQIAFLRGGQIWMTSSAGAPAMQVVRALGRCSELRWSPNGTALAFTSDRGDHSFIGIYRPGTKSVLYLDPSTDRDEHPSWNPESTQIAFIRQASISGFIVGAFRETAVPWSLRIADAKTGTGREVWHAEKGAGSVYRAIDGEQLQWMTGDRLAFPWERDGWLHLYTLTNGAATLLTPGTFEVDQVSRTADRTALLYASNQSDADRRHVWRVEIGKTPVAITKGAGIEWQPVDAGAGTVAYLRSGATEVARAAVRVADQQKDLGPEYGGMPQDLVLPQAVTIRAEDGIESHAQLFLPTGGTAPHPAVVFFHGGPRRQMLLGYHSRNYYSRAYSFNQWLASQGYVVLSLNYRSGTGYGLEFREALGAGNSGGAEFRDALAAGQYLAARSDVDPKRIGVWGGSHGGYLVALALARASNVFAAGVDMHGVHDWSIRPGRVLNAMNVDQLRAIEQQAFASSPLNFINGWKSPVLLIAGDDDRNVTFSQTVRMVEALRTRGVELEQLIFPGEIHEFLLHESWLKAYRAAADFLSRKLRP